MVLSETLRLQIFNLCNGNYIKQKKFMEKVGVSDF